MSSHVTDDGVRLHVEITGPDEAPTVVLAHGLADSVTLGWRATGVLDRLTAAGLRTVAYDARGHGMSEAPHHPERYGDDRLAADLAGIVGAYAGPSTVVAGYSMGAATILFAGTVGLAVTGAVVGAAPRAVLGWSDADETMRDTAIAVLEGRQAPDAAMQSWLDFLKATNNDKAALAAFLRGHRPVVEHWDHITAPTIVAAGVDDATAAPTADVVSRLPRGRSLDLPGDHFTAMAAPAFTDAIVELARSST